MNDRLWTTKDVCEYARVSRGTVKWWRDAIKSWENVEVSKLPYMKLGPQSYRYDPVEVKAWIRNTFLKQ